MERAERAFGDLQIQAAAVPARGSCGFHAAVVVLAPGSATGRRFELFRDDCLLGGRVWMDPGGALAFALDAGQAAILAWRRPGGRAPPAAGRDALGAA